VLRLTDDLIQGTIDSITGFIVQTVAESRELPAEQVMEYFLTSKTYALLSDKETGLYWDSLPELVSRFETELDAPTSGTVC
jgi:hypothetical protein